MFHHLFSPLYTLFALAGPTTPSAPLSDMIGVYALVDRVVIEGDVASPRAIQVWGVFSLADKSGPMAHTPAQRGYLYYSFNASNANATRAEWADLKAVAGTGQTVAFGARYSTNGHVRPAVETPANPDLYPLGVGMNKLPNRYVQPQQIGEQVERELRGVPATVTPAEAARVPAGAVRLVAGNALLANAQYVFEIKGPGTESETSSSIRAGAGQTAWTPRMQLRSGSTYTWKVWTVEGDWRSQPASAGFRTN